MGLRRLLLGLSLAFGAGLFLHTLLASEAWVHRERVRQDLQTIRMSNAAAEQELAGLRRRIDALRRRPEVRERAVRHELSFLRPNEGTLILPPTPKSR